jgi:hypothetical protein
MVRGWQKRVEETAARRVAGKQRRQKKDTRASFKAMVAVLLAEIDKHRHSDETVFHIWTDAIPSDLAPIRDSNSMDADDEPKRKSKGGGRNNKSEGGKNRKGRGKDDEDNNAEADERDRLCRKQFYAGQCDDFKKKKGGGKKSFGCQLVHYSNNQKQKTLAAVLNPDTNNVLVSTETAMIEASLDDVEETATTGMEMLHYFSINFADYPGKPDGEHTSVAQALSQTMADKSCNYASLVYVAIEGGTLLFDRYQGGLQEVPDLARLLGDGKRVTENTPPNNEAGVVDNIEKAASIPSSVLEYILMFLPDIAVATMIQVCSSWHKEIGTTSPSLWKHLLLRREWPLPNSSSVSSGDNALTSTVENMRDTFTLHYQADRDVSAIKQALVPLYNPRRGGTTTNSEIEMVSQAFSARRTAPQEGNGCVSIHIWSPTEVIAAYVSDCTIRLFKAVEKEGGEKACRELVSVSVDPFRNTKKHRTTLVAMELDDETIGCLLHDQGSRQCKSYLSFLSRDDYLEAAGSNTYESLGWSELEEEVLKVVDIGKSVLNHIADKYGFEQRLLPLADFLSDGGSFQEVEVLVSKSLVACGHGRFLVEAAIYIPDEDFNDDAADDEESMILLDRKLVIFASTVGSIIWLGDSILSERDILRDEGMILSAVRHGAVGSRMGCSIVAASTTSPTILLLEVDATGKVADTRQLEAADIVHAEILSSNLEWEVEEDLRFPVALTQTEVLVVDVISMDQGDRPWHDHKSIISFYLRFPDREETRPNDTFILEHCKVTSVHKVRDQHVLLICEQRENAPEPDSQGTEGYPWHALLFHIPTRIVISRHRLPDNLIPRDLSIMPGLVVAWEGMTIGVGVSCKGIIMTGADVRAVGRTGSTELATPSKNNRNKKKKNARKPNDAKTPRGRFT